MNEDIIEEKQSTLADPLHFTGPEEIDIKNIATSVSRLCYFLGFGDRFYSLAQHCVISSTAVQVSILLSKKFQTMQETGSELEKAKATFLLWRKAMKAQCYSIGLAYVGVLAHSLLESKYTFSSAYHRKGIKSTEILYRKYGLGDALDPYIFKIDSRTLATEMTWVTDLSDPWKELLVSTRGEDVQPFSNEIIDEELRVCWDAETARTKFIERFKEVWLNLQKWRKIYHDLKEEAEVAEKEREAIQTEGTVETAENMDF